MDIEKTIKNLKARHFEVSHFENKEAAVEYLVRDIGGKSVGIGGSKTADQMGLYDALRESGSEVFWHWRVPGAETLASENAAEVFISGANAIAETGEIVNIDGRGNRLAGMVFGKKTVYIIAGTNKICESFEDAVYRARNTAATENVKRFDVKTPCKIDGKCHDCRSLDRVCNAMLVLWGPMMDMVKLEVVLIDEDLGM